VVNRSWGTIPTLIPTLATTFARHWSEADELASEEVILSSTQQLGKEQIVDRFHIKSTQVTWPMGHSTTDE
jgi:hypothetical protein